MRKLLDLREGLQLRELGWGSVSLRRLRSYDFSPPCPTGCPTFPFLLLRVPLPPYLQTLSLRAKWQTVTVVGEVARVPSQMGRGRKSPVVTDRPSPATRNVGAQAGPPACGLWARVG